MTVSPNRKFRNRLGRKTSSKRALSRLLKMESLERRELMAADLAPFHNYLAPSDVDGDFQVSPLDALVVINQLNSSGMGSLNNRNAPDSRRGLVDADGDNILSPLDALTVINTINRGEGVGELAEVQYEFYALNADGTIGRNLDPNLSDDISEAVVGTGEKFVVRTVMLDLRSNPLGIFSAYHDLNFTNEDGTSVEKLELQWSESNALKLTLTDTDPDPNNTSTGILSGNFKIRYGSEMTATINVAKRNNGTVDNAATARNIQAAIEALPSIGAGNAVVRVNTIDPSLGHNFDIYFRNSRARQDIANAVLEEVNLTVSAGSVSTSISSQTNPDPSDPLVARAAFNYTPTLAPPPEGVSPQVTRYTNGPSGNMDTSSVNTGARSIRFMGGFANSLSYSGDAFEPIVVMETAFAAGASGVVNLAGSISVLPESGSSNTNNLGIALYGAQGVYLDSTKVVLPTAKITINDRLTATTDVFASQEDAAQTAFNVVANDVDRFGTARGVVAVTQPSVGGTVTIGSGANPQSILFTPSKDYNGPVVFTYTIRNNVTPVADEAIGTVTINVAAVNDAPVVIGTQFSISEDAVTPLTIQPSQVFSPGPADEAGQTVSFTILTPPPANEGTAAIVDGNLVFTPFANFFGTVNLVVQGVDNGPTPNLTTPATLTINVVSVNDAPNIVNTTFSVAEDPASPLTITPSQLFNPGPANESSQIVTLAILTGPASGTATITPGGSLQYAPALNFFGQVNIVVQGTDNGIPNAATISTVVINVTPVNDAPIAVADTGVARFNAIGLTTVESSLNVMVNDSAGPGEDAIDTIRIRPFTNGTTALGGSVRINADGTRVLYTPPADKFTQVDSFQYTIEDSFGLTATATAEVFIVPPQLPYALDDSFVGAEDSPSNPFQIPVLGNDLFNEDATPSLVRIATQPGSEAGSASVNGSNVSYQAAADYFGSTTLVYEMTDSQDSEKTSLATVFIRITEVNDAPVAVAQNYNGVEDTPLQLLGSTITATLSRGAANEANQTLTVTEATLLTSGAGVVSLDNGNINFNPFLDFNGDVLVRYTVRDNGTTNGVLDPKTSTATLTITLAAVNDAPITTNKTFPLNGGVTREDESFTFATADVIAGDLPGPANESSQTVSFVNLTGPITTARGGTITQVGTNLIYSPAKDFNGTDTFTYGVADNGVPSLTASGVVTIVVSEVNDAPVATDLSQDAFAGVTTVIDLSDELAAMSRGASNEIGQSLKIISVTPIAPFVGQLTLNANGTSVTYVAPLDTDTTVAFDFVVQDNGTTVGQPDFLTDTGRFTLRVLPFIPSSIRGTVYIDDNANNVIDHTNGGQRLELPVGGVEVTLSYANPTNLSQLITVTEMTEADGSYDFELLPPGTYTVSYVNPVSMTSSSSTVRSFTATINPPGNTNLTFDFPVLGINPQYGSSIEYLASSFYMRDSSLRSRGMYAVVNSTGYTEWTSKKDGFEGDLFHEVVLSDDGSRAYLTAVRGDDQVFTATLVDRRQFIRIPAGNGNTLIRILASSSDLVWNQVDLAAPAITAKGYLDTVDQFFEQEDWN